MIYWELFITFFKIGAFTFGGGYAMLPLIQQEVISKGWLETEELIDFVAISESTPGPFAVNVSTYVGTELAGVWGALCATLGVVLPSFIIILIVAGIYDRFRKSRIVNGAMAGLKPAVVGLIASVVLTAAQAASFGIPGLQVRVDFKLIAGTIMLVGAIVALFKKVNPIIIIVSSAVLGIVISFISKYFMI